MKTQSASLPRWSAAVLLGAMALCAQATSAPMAVIYPAKGQSPAQTDQDKLACFQWGRAQSGFDPMQAPPAAGASTGSVRTEGGAPPTPATSALSGSMVKGAAGGAAVAELTKGDAGKGAAIGVLGAALRDGMTQQQMKQQQQHAQQRARQTQAAAQQQLAQQRAIFERAFGACLEGRGYVVR